MRMPMNKIFSKFQRFLLMVATAITLSGLLIFGFPSLAQVNPGSIPRIEIIGSTSEDIPPAYRLVISQPQHRVYVFCPADFEAELSYVRNVKAIQCNRSSIS